VSEEEEEAVLIETDFHCTLHVTFYNEMTVTLNKHKLKERHERDYNSYL
jgi:hypothetical protein